MHLPNSIREQFRRQGRRGGEERARRLSADDRRAVARKAAIRRWVRARFGAPSFRELGLPGGALIDRGLDDLAYGRETQASLAVSLAWPRLAREGVPLPKDRFSDADHRLYHLLARTEGELAHARYRALRRELVSFADACPLAHRRRSGRGRGAR